jgi:hypothetical protein
MQDIIRKEFLRKYGRWHMETKKKEDTTFKKRKQKRPRSKQRKLKRHMRIEEEKGGM